MKLGLAIVIGFVVAAAPAHAADDGQAPIWSGIGSVVGPVVGFSKDPPAPIDYHERGKLVLPSKVELTSPRERAVNDPAWPRDPDVARYKKALDGKKYATPSAPAKYQDNRFPDKNVVITTRAVLPDGSVREICQGGSINGVCRQPSSSLSKFNPLGWVGLGAKEPDEPGIAQEPDRGFLTDPPKGYRVPVGKEAVAAGSGPSAHDAAKRKFDRGALLPGDN